MSVFIAAALAGCGITTSAGADVDKTLSWEQDYRNNPEAFVRKLQSCMDGKGWHVTVDENGGFLEAFTSEEELQRAVDDKDQCLVQMGFDDELGATGVLTEKQLRDIYRIDIQTHKCLVKQGLQMAPPPSEETYVERTIRSMSGEEDFSWYPYLDDSVIQLSEERIAQLKKKCPERWTFGS